MKVLQCVFSPTGGTQRVVDILASGLGTTVNKIDLTKADNDNFIADTEKYDIAVIAVPSYGGRVPELATQRLSVLQGNNMNCVVVCVYGNRAYENTLVELNDVAAKCEFNVIAAVSAIAEHSIVHQYATGRPDLKDEKELNFFADKIVKKIENNNFNNSLELSGNRPYKKSGGAGLVPKANKNCTACGLCAQVCPAQAINSQNPKITDRKKCISCMRCVTQCPQSARSVNSVMVSAAALAIKKACAERKDNELFI